MYSRGAMARFQGYLELRRFKKDELNELVEFLCSEKSSYMTGSIISMDGGYTSW